MDCVIHFGILKVCGKYWPSECVKKSAGLRMESGRKVPSLTRKLSVTDICREKEISFLRVSQGYQTHSRGRVYVCQHKQTLYFCAPFVCLGFVLLLVCFLLSCSVLEKEREK